MESPHSTFDRPLWSPGVALRHSLLPGFVTDAVRKECASLLQDLKTMHVRIVKGKPGEGFEDTGRSKRETIEWNPSWYSTLWHQFSYPKKSGRPLSGTQWEKQLEKKHRQKILEERAIILSKKKIRGAKKKSDMQSLHDEIRSRVLYEMSVRNPPRTKSKSTKKRGLDSRIRRRSILRSLERIVDDADGPQEAAQLDSEVLSPYSSTVWNPQDSYPYRYDELMRELGFERLVLGYQEEYTARAVPPVSSLVWHFRDYVGQMLDGDNDFQSIMPLPAENEEMCRGIIEAGAPPDEDMYTVPLQEF